MEVGTQDSSQLPITAEEEALKRNTDCIYFLASPLTCKKGSECEYRHSDYARVNPRDCWYWLNGNCLNPKCSFRHPPLDGLVGTPVAASAGSYLPPSQTGALTQIPAAHTPTYNLGKPAIPCLYFQKGLCLKGDRCSFTHGPQPSSNLIPQTTAQKFTTSVTGTQTLKKAFGGLEKCTQQQNIPQVNIKPVEVPPAAKPAAKAETAPPKNGLAVYKNMQAPTMLDDELPRYKSTNFPPMISGNSISRSHRSRQAQLLDDRSYQNGKVADEFLGETSPGFDVLVDDELRDSDYYHNEDEFGKTRSHEGTHLSSVKEFDYDSSADYSLRAKDDRDSFNNPRGYESHGREQDQRRASSERILQGSSVQEVRGFPRAESPNQINESDLRHRLLKQRRVNCSRSAVSPDRHGDLYQRDRHDHHVEEQRYRGRFQRDSRQLPHENSRSSRLQGRLTLPGRSSPDKHNDLHPETELEKGRNWGSLSPGRPSISSHQGRLQDRIKRSAPEDFNIEGRNFRGRRIRGDEMDNNISNFAGPRSLAELKGATDFESSKEQHVKSHQLFHLGQPKSTNIEKLVGQEYESSLLFEGPKPLSVILKRKRDAETAVSGSDTVSGNGEKSNQRERVENLIDSSRTPSVKETQSVLPLKSVKEANHHAFSIKDMLRTVEEDGLISLEGDEVVYEGQSSHTQRGSESIDDAMEDQDLETFDQRDDESDYEQVDGVDLKIEEEENADLEEEYMDDEDGDDFAKKIGVMFS
ncbi:hypothetical protein HHK36_006611 [Tetracentron sinense]|uniref:C3H1-type domain-containing protein n=1 Tax=Tetracentron sinense TaxID=13715 RepID=A0A835DPB9_TETSI|nr:hypothetical protein HHK36_006611 [Tetracentron sinense]